MAKVDYVGSIVDGTVTHKVAGSIGLNPTTNNLYRSNGNAWKIFSVNGSILVNPRSPIGAQAVREIPLVNTTAVRIDFGSAIVKAVRIWAQAMSGALGAGERILLSIDAPTPAIDTIWLADPAPDDGTISTQRKTLIPGTIAKPSDVYEVEFLDANGAEAPIRYVTVKATAVTTSTFRAFVEYKL